MEVIYGYIKQYDVTENNGGIDIKEVKIPIVIENEDCLPPWYYTLRDKIPAYRQPATGKVAGKVKAKVVDLEDNMLNDLGITCQDCGSTRIAQLVKHGNGSILAFCKRHK